eukprot:2929328-Amphidinium_carterae.1
MSRRCREVGDLCKLWVRLLVQPEDAVSPDRSCEYVDHVPRLRLRPPVVFSEKAAHASFKVIFLERSRDSRHLRKFFPGIVHTRLAPMTRVVRRPAADWERSVQHKMNCGGAMPGNCQSQTLQNFR